jgi:hypothetical protein
MPVDVHPDAADLEDGHGSGWGFLTTSQHCADPGDQLA